MWCDREEKIQSPARDMTLRSLRQEEDLAKKADRCPGGRRRTRACVLEWWGNDSKDRESSAASRAARVSRDTKTELPLGSGMWRSSWQLKVDRCSVELCLKGHEREEGGRTYCENDKANRTKCKYLMINGSFQYRPCNFL